MEHRELGRNGLVVSRVWLGCGNFGGIGSAPAFFGMGESEEQASELMDAASRAGIGVFDTADAYGGGRSETWIGTWLRSRAAAGVDPPLISTKVFHPLAEGEDRGLAPQRVLRQAASSLERLGIERLDVYLIHEPDPETPVGDTLGALDELVAADKAHTIGASNVDVAYLEAALAVSRDYGLAAFACVQNSFSLLDRKDEDELLPLCAEQGLGYIAFSPLAAGLLTGKYRAGEGYPAGSRMSVRPGPFADLANERTFAGVEALADAAAARGVDMPTLALAWVLSHPHVTAVVVGPRRPEHLEPAIAALELQLTPSDRDELAALFS